MDLAAALAELFPGKATYTREEVQHAEQWAGTTRKRLREAAFEEVKQRALVLDARVEHLYAGLLREDLVSTATFCRVVPPDVVSDEICEFHYMGRAVTGDVIDFISSQGGAVPILKLVTNPGLKILFITGTPGAGKSVSVIVAAAYLHLAFTRNPQESRRTAFLNVRDFIRDPGYAIWSALILAFIKDTQVLNALASVVNFTEDNLIKFLKQSGRAKLLYLLFDDGNKLDSSVYTEHQRSAARSFIDRLANLCTVVICSSIQSKLRKDLSKDTSPKHLLICGGYTSEEMDAYGRHLSQTLRDGSYRYPPYSEAEKKAEKAALDDDIRIDEGILESCREVTGRVPRLVYEFLLEPSAMESAVDWYKQQIRTYIEKQVGLSGSELVKAVRGEPVSRLTEAMDSRAFYRGQDGRGKCLTLELKSFTLALLAEKMTAMSEAYAKEAVEAWVRPVRGDRNAPRIGWNAEEATILTLKLLKPVIDDFGIRIEPHAVRTLPKTFSRTLLQDTPTLYVPEKFNHVGADVYYSDSQWVIVIQISIARKAKDHHKRTLEVAGELFQHEPRRKLVLWIVRTGQGWAYEGSKALPGDAQEVTLAFGSIHSTLAPIDERIRQLTPGKREADDVCPVCKVIGTARDADWIGCDMCPSWVHMECSNATSRKQAWICTPCRFADAEEIDDVDRDPLHVPERPYLLRATNLHGVSLVT